LVSEGDCNEGNDQINPGMEEICDGIDNNCDGNIDEGFDQTEFWIDSDNDNFGDASISVFSCFQPDGYADNANDCNDNDPNINPTASEECDGIDNNCNAMTDEGYATEVYYLDSDGDGYGNSNVSVTSCFQPEDYVSLAGDCNDVNGNINPGATESCNGADDDCSGAIDDNLIFQVYYEDDDNDGYGNPDVSTEDCEQPNGYVLNNLDCDDSDEDVNPDGIEILDDGIDQDCNGEDLVTSISELEEESITVYPNPSESLITVSNASPGSTISIIDTRGREVKSITITNSNDTLIDVSSLAKGTYLLKMISSIKVETVRLVIQ